MLSPGALADADPPSDVLLTQNVYTPYTLTEPALADALNAVVDEAYKAGYKIRVAVIAALNDLGSVPDFLDKPQPYAEFLDNELSYGRKSDRPLLTVMKAGFGFVNITPKEQKAVAGLKIPSDANADTLTKIAIAAVPKLSTAAGHPIKPSKLAYTGKSAGGGTSPLLIIGLPIMVLAVAGMALALRHREHEEHDGEEDEDRDEDESEEPEEAKAEDELK